MFGIGTILNVILTLLSPVIVKYSKSLFIAARIVQGLGQAGTCSKNIVIPKFPRIFNNYAYILICHFFCFLFQGVVFPTFNAMASYWIPIQERSFVFATVLSGILVKPKN